MRSSDPFSLEACLCVLASPVLVSSETHSRHCPRRARLFPTLFLSADDGPTTSTTKLQVPPAPPTGPLLTPSFKPAPSSQRNLSRAEGERTGSSSPLLVASPSSPQSLRGDIGSGGCGRRQLITAAGVCQLPSLGLAWPLLYWDMSPVTEPLTLACFVQHRLPGPMVGVRGCGEEAQRWS